MPRAPENSKLLLSETARLLGYVGIIPVQRFMLHTHRLVKIQNAGISLKARSAGSGQLVFSVSAGRAGGN